MVQYTILSTSPTFTRYSGRAASILKENNCSLVMIPPNDLRQRTDFKSVLSEAHAWVVGINKVYAEDLECAPNLKLIIKHGTGVDSIDLKAAAAKGITVANAPGTNANSVADLAFGFILGLARQIVSADKRTRGGFWGPIMGQDVFGKTIGVLGLGQIGKGVIRRAKGFGMNVLGYDVVHDEAFEEQYGVRAATLDEIMSSSDYISVHLPLFESTRNIIDREQLEKMRSTAFIVNTSRGGVVNEAALYDLLSKKRIAGAALDVFKTEPPTLSPFFELDNVIVAPHMGAYTEGAMGAISEIVSQSIVNVIDGKPPMFEVKSN
ncbi:glyoxylate reductase [Desulfosporosinus fructosivorans]|uniref:Glyoxylate reductase n=1 Tax=Desulfosporosinus fructosivorans TaxID=2018669 RepID=A0A4Z0RAF1_9FIRM|nr:phosphoglycerate dehydrogenase [Desulfosporosinus fructosivorans]TGE39107.1 glyoxylate reductase [Desulfosporosinus fructosivorans]